MTDDNEFWEALDTEYVPEEGEAEEENVTEGELTVQPTSKELTKKQAQADEDFQRGRDLLSRTAESLEAVMDHLDNLATQAETPAFFDSYSKVIAQAENISKGMMDLHQKRDHLAAFIDEPAPTQNNMNIENAVVYTGTIADMQRQLKRQKEEEETAEDVTDIEPEDE